MENIYYIDVFLLAKQNPMIVDIYSLNPLKNQKEIVFFKDKNFEFSYWKSIQQKHNEGLLFFVEYDSCKKLINEKILNSTDSLSFHQKVSVMALLIRKNYFFAKELQEVDIFYPDNFPKNFSLCCQEKSFKNLFVRLEKEIMALPYSLSETVTQAKKIVTKNTLKKENIRTKTMALTYFFLKWAKIAKKEEDLIASLLASCFLFSGMTQLNRIIAFSERKNLEGDSLEHYQKNIQLSFHLLNKIYPEISKQVKEIMGDVWENSNGTGYPQQKMGQFIHPFSQVIRFWAEFCFIENENKEETIFNLLLKVKTEAGLYMFDENVFSKLNQFISQVQKEISKESLTIAA